MNVYDFDKTIYPGDSATHFWWYCVRRHPEAVTSALRALGPLSAGLVGRTDRGRIKQALYTCLRYLPDAEKAAWGVDAANYEWEPREGATINGALAVVNFVIVEPPPALSCPMIPRFTMARPRAMKSMPECL